MVLLPASTGTQAPPVYPAPNIICQIRFMISVSEELLANVQYVSLPASTLPALAQPHHMEFQQVKLIQIFVP